MTRLDEMAQINMADANLLKLEGTLILIEEGLESNVDETLARVHEFYRRFAPYNRLSEE